MKKMKAIIVSADTIAALVVIIISMLVIPDTITNKFCITIYSAGITILAIIFSIFFAALTVIMAFPDNAFIAHIEEKGLFTKILEYFKTTLFILFSALILTICLYIYTAILEEDESSNRIVFIVFLGIFFYSLFATMIAINFTIGITTRRAQFLINQKSEEEKKE